MTHSRLPQEKAMRQQQMTRLIHSLPQLTHHQRQQLASCLQALLDHSRAIAVVEAHGSAHRACPHCASLRIVKNGSANGLQRFKCRQCARTFNALTGTPLAHLHLRDKWMGQAQALVQGLSLPQAAQRLGVAQSTAFRWRHRFLACTSSMQARRLVGIAEADESYFLNSCKGQRGLLRRPRRRGGKALAGCKGSDCTPVLMARDRAGATANLILQTNKAQSVQAALQPLLPPDTVLCTDGSVTLASAARALGVQHQAVNVSRGVRVRGPWHVQNVNAYVSRLRGWMQRFKGVATRYLDSYLGWFRMLDRSGPMGLQPALMLGAAMGEQGRH
jgi:transposase-like protein